MLFKELPEYFVSLIDFVNVKGVEVKQQFHIKNVAKYFEALLGRSTVQQ